MLEAYRLRQLAGPTQAAAGSGRVDGSGSPLVVVDSVCATDVNDPQICVHTTTNGQTDLATTVFDFANEAWAAEVDAMGFQPPHADDNVELGPELDIYLAPANGGAFAAPESSAASDGTARADASGYVVIDDLIDPTEIGTFVAHELHHLIQFSYDVYEHDNAYESTSVFVEDRVYDDINDYTRFIASFQSSPENAVDWFPGFQSPDLFYIYGSAEFLIFLSERYGNDSADLIRQMWESSTQNDMNNEPDYFDALTDVLPVSLDDAYAEFAAWRAFVGDDATDGYFSEGSEWANTPPVASHGLAQMPVVGGTSTSPPMEYGANYIQIDTSGGLDSDRLKIHIDGDTGTDWSLSVAGVPLSGGTPCEATATASGGSADVYVDSLNLYSRIVVVVANLGSGDRDPDDADYGSSSYAYDVDYASEASTIDVTGLQGCPAVSDEPVGCKCNVQTPKPSRGVPIALWVMVLGVAIKTARDRRAHQ